jgi:DNA-binding SARP family transcriptional activator
VADAAARVEEAAVLADGELVAQIAATLAGLATALRQVDRAPWPRLMQVHAGQLEVLLHAPSPNPPTGWRAAADGLIWTSELLTPHDTQPGSNDVRATPALVSFGGLDDGGVLLDVEAEGVIGITGTPDCVDDFARSIAAELATTPFAHIHAVGVVGMHMPGAEALGIKQYESLADAVAEERGGAEGVVAALDQLDSRSSFELRCRYPDEPWTPTILIVAASSAARERTALDQLLGMAGGGGRGLGLVIVGDAPPGCLEVQVYADEIALPALGLQFRPQLLTVDVADAVAELLGGASAETIPTPTEPMTLFETASLHDDGPQLRVNVLGPIGVEGAAVEIKPQQLALLAYLATHPDASGDALRDALWGGRPPSQERFLNAIHELRRAIGSAHLPPAVDGRYSLHAVTTDAALFETHLALAETNQATVIEAIRTALELVTGPPFSYDSRHRRHFTWVDLGNHSSRLERLIADAAHGLAVTALDTGDSHLAAWAAHKGLLACPANETLVGDVMAAHLLAGDTRAAESVLREYERALDELGIEDPPDALHALLERKRAS